MNHREEGEKIKAERQTKIIYGIAGNEWWSLLSFRGNGGSIKKIFHLTQVHFKSYF